MLAEEWLTTWARQLQVATARAVRDVLSTYPYESGAQRIGPPPSTDELVALRDRLPWIPDELVALQRQVGPVSLPDIANGYFLHPVEVMIGSLDGDRAHRIGEPFARRVDIVVFGSTGGGDLYAMGVDDGQVFRLQDAAYHDGVYDGTAFGITVVGADLRDFLRRLLAAVDAFADDGSVTDL